MAMPSSLMSTISCRSRIALLDSAVKLAYAGVWILCRTRRRRLGETGRNTEFMTAMGNGPEFWWLHISAGFKKSKQRRTLVVGRVRPLTTRKLEDKISVFA